MPMNPTPPVTARVTDRALASRLTGHAVAVAVGSLGAWASVWTVAAMLTVTLGLSACAGDKPIAQSPPVSQPQPSPESAPAEPQEEKIEFQPLVILMQPDQELGLDSYDDETLLSGGVESLIAYKYRKALLYFRRLVAEFPQSPLFPEALFRLGVTHGKLGELDAAHGAVRYLGEYVKRFPDGDHILEAEASLGLALAAQGQHDEAVSHYRTVIAREPQSPQSVDTRFYLGDSLLALERWTEARDTFAEVSIRGDITLSAEIEGYTKWAQALLELDEIDLAERHVGFALRQYRAHEEKETLDRRLAAHAQYLQGEVERRRFLKVVLEYPQSLLKDRLEEKCQFLLNAQSHYIRAIRYADLQFAAASGYRVGQLYEDLYNQLMAVPVPDALTHDEESEIYREEVLKKVQVIVKKSITVYERTLDMAGRTGLAGKWVEQTRDRLMAMKSLYLSNEAKLAESLRLEAEARAAEQKALMDSRKPISGGSGGHGGKTPDGGTKRPANKR
jgi:tetratricopeptide (TPR) repeat protein